MLVLKCFNLPLLMYTIPGTIKRKKIRITPPPFSPTRPLRVRAPPPYPTPPPPAFTNGGCATLTDLYNAQSGSGPLYVLDSSNSVASGSPTGRWLLTSSLEVLDGVTLYVHGTSDGGDADVLRIQVRTSMQQHGGGREGRSAKVDDAFLCVCA